MSCVCAVLLAAALVSSRARFSSDLSGIPLRLRQVILGDPRLLSSVGRKEGAYLIESILRVKVVTLKRVDSALLSRFVFAVEGLFFARKITADGGALAFIEAFTIFIDTAAVWIELFRQTLQDLSRRVLWPTEGVELFMPSFGESPRVRCCSANRFDLVSQNFGTERMKVGSLRFRPRRTKTIRM